MKKNLFKPIKQALFFASWAVLLPSCQSFEGRYADPNETRIIDVKWNEADARQTSEALVDSMLQKPWLSRYEKATQTRPILIIDEIENRTHEHIDTKAVTSSLHNKLINSGRVRFLNASQRAKILKEINYQNKSGMVDPAKAKRFGKQLGAGFMLSGHISSQTHSHPDLDFKTVYYQVDLTLTNLETSEIEWSEQSKVKKTFSNSSHEN